jgi:hypothetical protein
MTHSYKNNVPCPECGDLDGCHEPNRLKQEGDCRPFPIQADNPFKPRCTIPWWLAEIAFKGYAKLYPSSARNQPLERLAERGGFGREEVVMLIIEGRKNDQTRP